MLVVVVVLVLFGGLCLGLLLWAGGGKTIHEPHGSGIIEAIPDALERDPVPSGPLVVLTSSLAYGLGVQRCGTASVDVRAIYDRLDHVVERIADAGADVAVLQDVDFASRRTFAIDQLHYIAAALGWGFAARVLTWECRYLPWPWRRPTGRLRAGMGVISRYPLVQNTRQRLSQACRVPVLASWFFPYHMVQMVDVQCGTQTIRLFNVSLEAHDVTARQRQARQLAEFVRQAGTPTSVLLGALHAPFPGAVGTHRQPDTGSDQALAILLEALHGDFRATVAVGAISLMLVGRGMRASGTRAIPLDGLDIASSPVVAELRWALPLDVHFVSPGSDGREKPPRQTGGGIATRRTDQPWESPS